MLDEKLPEENSLISRKKQFQTVFGEAALFIYFKSIRLDKAHFAREFLNSVIQCQGYQKDPLRPPSTARYKVTYRPNPDSQTPEACIMLTDRNATLTEAEKNAGVLGYHAMHTEEKKQGFSPKQSASLLTPETYINVFGFTRSTAPLAGFIFTEPNTLGGGHNGLYDGGTIGRPYRFNSLADAMGALNTLKIHGTAYKMARKLDELKDIHGRYYHHTESLVRVRFTRENPGKIAIFKDDLASRWYALYLQALTAAQFKEQAEAADQRKEEKSITPPIYYYLPDSLKCFTDYTTEEQATDRDAAEAINSNKEAINSNKNEKRALAKIQDKEFWFLLGLSKKSLVARLNSILKVEGVDMPVLSYLMLTGYVGLARGLAKLAGVDASEDQYWVRFKPPVPCEETESDSHPLQTQADPQFIGQAALHFPEQYKRLDSRLLEAKDSKGKTALHTAAHLGFPKRVEALLAADGINVNAKDIYNKTPLHLAASRGHVAVVNALIQQGAIVDATDDDGRTPLHWAAQFRHVDMVKLLVLAGADATGIEINGQSILRWAAQFRHVDMVKKLVLAGADAAGIEINGQSILHWAAASGHVAVVNALIQQGAIVDATDNDSRIPLHWAAEKGHVKVVNALIQKGAEIDAKNIWRRAPLHLAAQYGHVAVVNALIQQGADVNAVDNFRSTPLHLAAENGHVDVVNALLSAQNIQVNTTNSFSQTPLHSAALRGYDAVVKKLVLAGADAAGIEINGQSILHWAAQNGHADVVTALLGKAGIDVNARDRSGCTPLHWAAENSHVAVVKTLLKADQQTKLFQSMLFIERSGTLIGAAFSGLLLAETISSKEWTDTLSHALQSQVGMVLCAAVLLAGCIAACRQLFYLRTRAAYAQATCRQRAGIVGGKLLMTGAAATLFAAVAFPQTGLMTFCNNPVTAGIVLGAVCLIGVASYMSDLTYNQVILPSEAGSGIA